ncbi:hypothetical protein MKZ38_006675 [Zalerion maritima]|uniref:CBM1 domain-containing protein n=1 Tax=Zalerion maritima TaxID=339359 RepID=A0AAD5RVE8_9PEZI|nr:hypothetical protein MKZ38_006675 [Zalerion maritima]
MRKTETLLALAATAAAQATVSPWGQCGGIGYTGATTCSDGYHCQYWNDYYYQCVEGAETTTTGGSDTSTTSVSSTTTDDASSTTTTTSSTTSSEPTSTGGVTCPGTFSKLTAEEYVAAMNPGWNLGNTLDAVPDEGSWNNAAVVPSTFAQVASAGFKSVRIPVTYAYHFSDDTSPDYTIDPDWLSRVEEVVDMALDAGLYVLTNVHHDSWIWMDITAGADQDMIREKFYRTWHQIGTQLACKGPMLSFESINELPAEGEEDAAFVNELNAIFLQALEDSGGFNADRVVNLVGPAMDATKTSQWFEPPAEVKNPWALQYHYYSPYDFVFSAWGKTTWGADSEVEALENELALVPGNFSVPLVIGEFDASQINCEPAGRWKWFDAVARMAGESGSALLVWDNGLDNLDRDTGEWRDHTAVEIVKSRAEGEANSLPDATTDLQATEQDSSAYVFHKVGDAVAAYDLEFSLNGNALESVATSSGSELGSSDYSVSGSTVTLSSSFLQAYLDTTEPGVKETLTFTFSAGASPVVEIVVWDVPEFPYTTTAATSDTDITFSITTKGVDSVAAAKMVLADGTYMFDDWTVYLGPLQQARATWSGQYYYEGDVLYIRAAVSDAVIAAGQDGILTFEFYPRVEGNSVEFTLTA